MAANGRHRRYQPSRINRASLTVTAGGAGIALPLITAASAGAATTDVWEKVAACESTGNWHINTGNGYYGGLQFSSSTWAAYGGTAYAASADQASKSQQIAVAEKVLAGQGKGAWPSCGVGLSGAAYTGGTAEGAPAPERKAEQPTTRSEQRTAPKATPKKAESKKTVTTPTGKKVKKGDGEYKVAAGDTLSKIAAAQKVKGGWAKLFELNKDVVEDADLIYPGQQLHLK